MLVGSCRLSCSQYLPGLSTSFRWCTISTINSINVPTVWNVLDNAGHGQYITQYGLPAVKHGEMFFLSNKDDQRCNSICCWHTRTYNVWSSYLHLLPTTPKLSEIQWNIPVLLLAWNITFWSHESLWPMAWYDPCHENLDCSPQMYRMQQKT